MDHNYDEDIERIVEHGEEWDEFKAYLSAKNPELDIDKVLEKPLLKRDPINSYGIIEFYIYNNTTELFSQSNGKIEGRVLYHVFRIRNSVEYSTLIRGYANKTQLFKLASLLSKDERNRILNESWEDIWNDYWIDHNDGSYTKLKSQAWRKFSELKDIVEIIDKYKTWQVDERPFIFAKGKMNKNETPLEAALREFKEETKVEITHGELYFSTPIVQHYLGSDDRKYCDHYFAWKREFTYSCPHQILDRNLRKETIGHELEEDKWIEIPIFASKKDQWEWERSIDPYQEFQIYKRHFQAIMEIHNHL